MANQWFRMYSEFATDPKVQMMSEAMQRRLLMVFCVRCSNGHVTLHETLQGQKVTPTGNAEVTDRDAEMAFLLRLSDDEVVKTKALFLAKGFIDEAWNPRAWGKRQYASDSSAARVSRHRAAKKEADDQKQKQPVTPDVTPCNVTVTPPEQNRTEQNRDKSPDGDLGLPSVADVVPMPGGCPHEKIISAYHAELPHCRQVAVWNDTRRKLLQTRWRENPERQTVDWWQEFFRWLGVECRSLTEQKFFDLEWAVRPNNFAKIVEGKYQGMTFSERKA